MTDDAPASPNPSSPHLKRGLKRLAIKIARIVIIAYIGLAIVLALFQTQLIFPGAASQGTADAIIDPARFDDGRAQLLSLTAPGGEKIAAVFGAALDRTGRPLAEPQTRPTLLHFYGNGMCMADCEIEFANFRRRGFNVMIADYLGYGMSGGKPSEAGVYATADACFDHLLGRSDIDRNKIVPVGWSLGAAAAFHLASTREQIPCIVAISAFTSMNEMARRLFPFLPTSAILRHHFDNQSRLTTMHKPLFLAHGRRDQIIPFDMSEKLAATATAAGLHVTRHTIDSADHNDIFNIGGRELLDAIEQFVNQHAQDQAK